MNELEKVGEGFAYEVLVDYFLFNNQFVGHTDIEGTRFAICASKDHEGGLEGFYCDTYDGTFYINNEAYYFEVVDTFCSETRFSGFDRDPDADLTEEDASFKKVVDKQIETQDNTNVNSNKEENTMTTQNTRTLYTVILMDNDQNLPVEHSLVAKFKNILSEESTEVIIQEILMNEDVKGLLEKHNEKRSKTVNQKILERTGSEVMLQPVKIKDLQWQVK